jgi:hypothetical protein
VRRLRFYQPNSPEDFSFVFKNKQCTRIDRIDTKRLVTNTLPRDARDEYRRFPARNSDFVSRMPPSYSERHSNFCRRVLEDVRILRRTVDSRCKRSPSRYAQLPRNGYLELNIPRIRQLNPDFAFVTPRVKPSA